MAGTGTLEYIYNELLAGAELLMEFNSAKEATTFRSALSKFKQRTENAALAVGLFSSADLQMLSFKKAESGEHNFILSFREKPKNQQFSFKILNDPDTEEVERSNDAEV